MDTIEEKFEEMKRKVISKLQYSEGIPIEINNILEQFKEVLISKATQEKVNFSSVLEYIETQFEVFKNSRLVKIGENRKDKKIDSIIYDITLAKEKLEEKTNDTILQGRKKEDESEANITTSKILSDLESLVENINSHYKGILSSRGYDSNTIVDMGYDFKLFARYYMQSRCERQMIGAFQKDNNDFRKFEKDILNEMIRDFRNKDTDEKRNFKEDLKSKAPTLKEQRQAAIERNAGQSTQISNNETKSLPDDILK